MAKRSNKTTSPEVANNASVNNEASANNGADNQQVAKAALAVDEAQAALQSAQQAYDQAVEATNKKTDAIGSLTVGEVLDTGLDLVRRFPAVGVATAGFIGFLLGRSLKR